MTTHTMRFVAHGAGGDPEVLKIEEAPLPVPGPSDVLIASTSKWRAEITT